MAQSYGVPEIYPDPKMTTLIAHDAVCQHHFSQDDVTCMRHDHSDFGS
jgi:hypothetical protein